MKKIKWLNLSTLTCVTAFFFAPSSQSSAQNINSDGSYAKCDAAGDIVLGKNGWISELWEWNSEYNFTTTNEIVDMNNAFKKRGITIIFVPVPSRAVKYSQLFDSSMSKNVIDFSPSQYASNWNDMIKKTSALGVHIVDLMPALKAYTVSSRGESFFYPRDHHWTTSGAEVSSQVVAQTIKDIIKQNSIPVNFTPGRLSVTKSGFNSGSFGDHYSARCKNKVAPMDAYKAVNTIDSSSLLGDRENQIDIFGDSFGFTNPDNNFSIFLEHYSGLSVTNYSVPGIGNLGSLIGYLADADINRKLPKFIVVPMLGWLPSDASMYRQITAEISGCIRPLKKSLRSYDGSSPNMTYSAENILQDSWYSIHIKFSEDVSKVNLVLKYKDNTTENISLDRGSNNFYKGDKRNFYIALQKSKLLSSAIVTADPTKKVQSKVELCNLTTSY